MTTASAVVEDTKVVVSGTDEARTAIKAIKGEKSAKAAKPAVKKRDSTLKARALEVFEAGQAAGKKNGEIAREMSEKLSITYANAYYYVTRVFKNSAPQVVAVAAEEAVPA